MLQITQLRWFWRIKRQKETVTQAILGIFAVVGFPKEILTGQGSLS